ncbi:hypothetical protein DOTSEDRAFT_47895 [Dothistroma septosporum NZE10]|uniref:Fungal N-terminal domain-containing protein n=1 Tax=Dothistroma septosporum (strain NZE10 / CBS 128990) TaxID=675120 RepID=M2YKG1_DOTSN|nr:hypothetical protein DOTSEDRAFT_47895 [Dothistroma septosporum NZE10]
MALDGISAAASVLQVAEMGFSLAKSIYTFVKAAKDARKALKIVAEDTRLVEVVLNRARYEIRKRSAINQKNIDADFGDLLQGTRNAFAEVGDFFSLLSGNHKLKFSGRLQYSFNKKEKLYLFLANLEKRA